MFAFAAAPEMRGKWYLVRRDGMYCPFMYLGEPAHDTLERVWTENRGEAAQFSSKQAHMFRRYFMQMYPDENVSVVKSDTAERNELSQMRADYGYGAD